MEGNRRKGHGKIAFGGRSKRSKRKKNRKMLSEINYKRDERPQQERE